MLKKLFFAAIMVILFLQSSAALAQESSFVTIINPIRGADFWDLKDQTPSAAVLDQMQIIKHLNLPVTWLIRFDALSDNQLISLLKSSPQNQEKGLFLEITPSWASASSVEYNQQTVWHDAGSAFLTGYTSTDRKKLIDTSFNEFKKIFGYFPKSVGAWWIDSYSLDYMQQKYGITGALIVADQYTTDNYQIWGQYWSYPYYPAQNNALIPAQSTKNKIPVVLMQWAARDPVNAYGDGVQESTYSVQANDYLDYHKLTIDYFSKLIDVFTLQKYNQVNQVVVGLENSYQWSKYKDEYKKQMEIISQKQSMGQITVSTISDFSIWYGNKFPTISPEQTIVADDPLGSSKKVVWYMNPYYRAGWFYNQDGSVFRDVRQYIDGISEPCFDKACNALNFATFSTRVLDDVTYKQKQVLDPGKIRNFQFQKNDGKYTLSYKNETGKGRAVEFLPRDISIDGKVSSIDGFILNAQSSGGNQNKISLPSRVPDDLKESLPGFLVKIIEFVLFFKLVIFIPGYLLVRGLKQKSFGLNIFLSMTTGFVTLTLISYLAGYLKMDFLVWAYVGISLLIFIVKQYYKELDFGQVRHIFKVPFFPAFIIILAGTFFQSLMMMRSGWVYDFGVGFWGPTGHDGIWHQALVNQLIKGVPPENPTFAGSALINYHYFYDLLVAATYKFTQIPVADLIYRFYPVLISLLFGLGTYLLVLHFTKSRWAVVISLYFAYFAGSFGWIVDLIKKQPLGGESAFWANQPVSMNLNPPFAISLILIIAVILLMKNLGKTMSALSMLLIILIAGSLIEFKVYAGVIVLGGFFIVALQELIFQKNLLPFKIFLGSLILSLLVFLPQNSGSGSLLVFSPFWFIHTMIDFTDRVGWERLSIARPAYIERGEWGKFFLIETLGFFIFLFGNLGTRFVALWKIKHDKLIFWMATISLIIPMIFIQKGTNWNTIQFFYYFIYFVAIFSGITWVFVYRKLPRIIGIPLLAIVLLITPVSAAASFRNAFYPNPPAKLSGGELEALTFLRDQLDGTVLTYPFDKNLRSQFVDPYPLFAYETTAYVSAFSNKPTYIEDEIQQEIFQNDYKKRSMSSLAFFQGSDTAWSGNFLKENGIIYIYLPKILGVPLNRGEITIKKIYENNEAEVYEVIK